MAQNSWKVCFDKKTLLSTAEEDDVKNLIKVAASDLTKHKSVVVKYLETEPQKDWERTITAYDENDEELSKQTGNKFSLSSAILKKLLHSSRAIRIYTVSLPTDPNVAAQIRVRRVHLCTLVLQ